jgi:hypothetical protein
MASKLPRPEIIIMVVVATVVFGLAIFLLPTNYIEALKDGFAPTLAK